MSPDLPPRFDRPIPEDDGFGSRGRCRSTYLYVIGAECGLYKIGATGYPDRRLETFQCGSPVELRLVLVRELESPHRYESYLHRRYRFKRRHGEWFELTANDLADIEYIIMKSLSELGLDR